MISIKSNIGALTEKMKKKLSIIGDREYLLRPVCMDVIDLMTKRIHVDGKASNDTAIGSYNKSYLKLREEKYRRNSDAKIIVSLTRQLENDWSVIATQKGFGIGFLNELNLRKARWVEENKDKKIFSLSGSEKEYAITYIQELTRKALQS